MVERGLIASAVFVMYKQMMPNKKKRRDVRFQTKRCRGRSRKFSLLPENRLTFPAQPYPVPLVLALITLLRLGSSLAVLATRPSLITLAVLTPRLSIASCFLRVGIMRFGLNAHLRDGRGEEGGDGRDEKFAYWDIVRLLAYSMVLYSCVLSCCRW
jgi:hypothetical protein